MTVEKKSLGESDGTTVAKLFDLPQTLCLELDGGEKRPEHNHPGKEILLFVHEGELDLRLDGESHKISKGDVIRFSGERDISPRAVEDTVALLVFVDS